MKAYLRALALLILALLPLQSQATTKWNDNVDAASKWIINNPDPHSSPSPGTSFTRLQDIAVGAGYVKSSATNGTFSTIPAIPGTDISGTANSAAYFNAGGSLVSTPGVDGKFLGSLAGVPTYLSVTVYADGIVTGAIQLASVASLSISAGAIAYVNIVGDYFKLVQSTLTPDNLTVVTASGKAGYQWVRLNIQNAANQIVTAWYVDPQAAVHACSDEATGFSSSAPLCTMAELARRVRGATYPIPGSNVAVAVYLESNMGASDGAQFQYSISGQFASTAISPAGFDAPFNVFGVPIDLGFSGVVSSPQNGALGSTQDIHFTDSGIPSSFTASGFLAANVIIKRTNGTVAWTWPAKDLGSKTLRTSQLNTTFDAYSTWSAADAYRVQTLPNFHGVSFPHSDTGFSVAEVWGVALDASLATLDGNNSVYWISDSFENTQYIGGVLTNCQLIGQQILDPNDTLGGGLVINSGLSRQPPGGGPQTYVLVGRGTEWDMSDENAGFITFDGIGLLADVDGRAVRLQAQFFDLSTRAAIGTLQGAYINLIKIGGASNSGDIFNVANTASRITYTNAPPSGMTSSGTPIRMLATSYPVSALPTVDVSSMTSIIQESTSPAFASAAMVKANASGYLGPAIAGADYSVTVRTDGIVTGSVQLVSVNAANMVEGAIAYVASVGDFFALKQSSIATTATTIVTASGKVGYQWHRLNIVNLIWAARSAWFIDPQNSSTTANDENDGATTSTPLLSWQELARRLWDVTVSSGTFVTLTAMSDGNTTDAVVMNVHIPSNSSTGFFITGALTPMYTGTISTYTAGAAGPAADDYEITDSTLPTSFTSSGLLADGLLARTTSGSTRNFYFAKDLGSKTARISAPVNNGGNPGVLTPGQSYAVYALKKIYGLQWPALTDQSITNAGVYLTYEFINDVSPGLEWQAASFVHTWRTSNTDTNVDFNWTNVAIGTGLTSNFRLGRQSVSFNQGLVRSNVLNESGPVIMSGTTFQGAVLQVQRGANIIITGRASFNDTASSAILVLTGSQVVFSGAGNLSGIGNTGALISTGSGGKVSYDATPVIAASTSGTPISINATGYTVAQLPVSDPNSSGGVRLSSAPVLGPGVTKWSASGIFATAADGTDYLSPTTGVPATRHIFTTAPMTGGGTLATDLTIATPVFAGSTAGLVPPSIGGTTTFLRADGSYAVPSGSAGITSTTGDVVATGPGSVPATIQASAVTTTKIATSAVTYAKIQNESAFTFIGNPNSSSGAPSEITLGAGCSFSGTTLTCPGIGVPNTRTLTMTAPMTCDGGSSCDLSANRTIATPVFAGSSAGLVPPSSGGTTTFLRADGTYATPSGSSGITATTGDVVATGPGSVPATIQVGAVTTTKIATSAVTYAKIQNESGETLLGNPNGSVAAPSEISIGSGCSFSGTTLNCPGTGAGIFLPLAGGTMAGDIVMANHSLSNMREAGFDLEFNNGNVTGASQQIADWTQSPFGNVTLTGNVSSSSFVNPTTGLGRVQLIVIQDGTGGRTLVWPASVSWLGGVAPVLSTSAGAKDYFSFYWNGTSYVGQSGTVIVWPVSPRVLISGGISATPVGDSTFTFDTTTHILSTSKQVVSSNFQMPSLGFGSTSFALFDGSGNMTAALLGNGFTLGSGVLSIAGGGLSPACMFFQYTDTFGTSSGSTFYLPEGGYNPAAAITSNTLEYPVSFVAGHISWSINVTRNGISAGALVLQPTRNGVAIPSTSFSLTSGSGIGVVNVATNVVTGSASSTDVYGMTIGGSYTDGSFGGAIMTASIVLMP